MEEEDEEAKKEESVRKEKRLHTWLLMDVAAQSETSGSRNKWATSVDPPSSIGHPHVSSFTKKCRRKAEIDPQRITVGRSVEFQSVNYFILKKIDSPFRRVCGRFRNRFSLESCPCLCGIVQLVICVRTKDDSRE